jgi:protein arginine kinase activator
MHENKCNKCHERQANVKLVRVVEGKAHAFYLCNECAAEVSPYQQQALSWQELLEKVFSQIVKDQSDPPDPAEANDEVEPHCQACGMTFSAYGKSFLLGCPECYEAFGDWLERQLERLHGATRHVGRAPRRHSVGTIDEGASTAVLKKDLERAVLREDFKTAARLRDRIRERESGVNPGVPEMPEK